MANGLFSQPQGFGGNFQLGYPSLTQQTGAMPQAGNGGGYGGIPGTPGGPSQTSLGYAWDPQQNRMVQQNAMFNMQNGQDARKQQFLSNLKTLGSPQMPNAGLSRLWGNYGSLPGGQSADPYGGGQVGGPWQFPNPYSYAGASGGAATGVNNTNRFGQVGGRIVNNPARSARPLGAGRNF